MPAAIATSEMKKIYGKVMRNICTVKPYFCGSSRNPRGTANTQKGGGDLADERDDKENGAKYARHVIDEGLGLVGRVPGLVFGEHRHEALGECALAENATQEIGDAEGDVEGIGRHAGAGADEACEKNIADETADPRQQGHTAGDGRGFKELAAHGCALVA